MARGFYGRVGVDYKNTMVEGLRSVKHKTRKVAINGVLLVAEGIRQRAHDLANVSPRKIGHARDGRHMRDCIDISLEERETTITARIGIDMSNVPYAAHQEFGARGKPFLRPAIDEARSNAHATLQGVLDGTEIEDAASLVRFRRFA